MVRKKTDPFWQYVDQRPNNRWKCKFCGNEYAGHVSRIKYHLGQVKRQGIDPCDNVDERVKEEALRALRKVKKASDKKPLIVEETTQQNDQGIGSKNNPFVDPSSGYNVFQDGYNYNQSWPGQASHLAVALHREALDKQQAIAEETTPWIDQGIGFENYSSVDAPFYYNPFQDYQPGYNYSQYRSGQASHLVVAEPSSVTFENNEQNSATLHAQSQQADPPPSSSFQQENEVNTVIGTENNLQLQNMSELGANKNSVIECTEFDQCLLTFKRKLECLDNQKEEKEEELHQWSKKVKTIKGDYEKMEEALTKGNHPSLEQLNQVKELVNRVEELGNFDRSEKETSRIAPSPSALPLLTNKLIGRDNEISDTWNSLVSDCISRVGIYGVGGVGRTEIMMNIYNKLVSDKAFDNVFWVTVGKDLSVYELQAVIGNAIHLDELYNEKNEKVRATMLKRFWTSGKKYVMILDGLWRSFDYSDVGITLTCGGPKLVITCRSLDVLQNMHCQRMIKISPFGLYENYLAGKLFMAELGVETELPKEVDKIAKDIVSACDGLPLLIKDVAKKMRGVENVRKWSYMMEKMNDFKGRLYEMKGLVFDQLYLSYELLNKPELQQCLIFCAFTVAIEKMQD